MNGVAMRATLALLALAATAPPALAQSEDRLRTFFEGKSVRVKIEMPGTEDGVDVYPGTTQPIDFSATTPAPTCPCPPRPSVTAEFIEGVLIRFTITSP
jgi:hypothetical protein